MNGERAAVHSRNEEVKNRQQVVALRPTGARLLTLHCAGACGRFFGGRWGRCGRFVRWRCSRAGGTHCWHRLVRREWRRLLNSPEVAAAEASTKPNAITIGRWRRLEIGRASCRERV